MAGQNIKDVFDNNPITVNDPNDLMYFGQSPYTSGDDAAMLFSDFAAQFATPAQVQIDTFNVAIDTGVADAYVAVLNPPAVSYGIGMFVKLYPSANNTTTTPTLDAGAGALPIVRWDLSPVAVNDITTTSTALFMFNGPGNSWSLLNPQTANFDSVTPLQVQEQAFTSGQNIGTGDALIVNLTPALTNYVDGAIYLVRTGASNATTTPTITIDTAGTIPIYTENFLGNIVTSILISDIPMAVACFQYSASQNAMFLLNSISSQSVPTNIPLNYYSSAPPNSMTPNVYEGTINAIGNAFGNTGIYQFCPQANNTGPSTLELFTQDGVSSGALPITYRGQPLTGGELRSGSYYCVMETVGSSFELLNPSFINDWFEITGTSATLEPNKNYVINNAGLVTLTLPELFNLGDEIKIAGLGAGGWIVEQNLNQQIHVGSVSTTVGVAGSIASTNQHDSIYLVGVVANLELTSLGGPQGTITIV